MKSTTKIVTNELAITDDAGNERIRLHMQTARPGAEPQPMITISDASGITRMCIGMMSWSTGVVQPSFAITDESGNVRLLVDVSRYCDGLGEPSLECPSISLRNGRGESVMELQTIPMMATAPNGEGDVFLAEAPSLHLSRRAADGSEPFVQIDTFATKGKVRRG